MAFFLVLLYSLIFTTTEHIFVSTAPHAVTVPALTLYWVLLFLYCKRNHLQKAAVTVPARGWRGFLSCLPLLVIPAVNLIFFKSGTFISSLTEALFLALCAFGEEVLFRGYLLTLWSRKIGTRTALIAVSLLFAVLHAVNLFSGISVWFFVIQCFCAGAVGFTLGAVTLREGSILPGTVIHILINLTSVRENALTSAQGTALLTASVFCLFYGIHLFQKFQKNNKGETL